MTATKMTPENFNLIAWQDKLVATFGKSYRSGRLTWVRAQKQLMALGYSERESYAIVGDAADVADNEKRIKNLGQYA